MWSVGGAAEPRSLACGRLGRHRLPPVPRASTTSARSVRRSAPRLSRSLGPPNGFPRQPLRISGVLAAQQNFGLRRMPESLSRHAFKPREPERPRGTGDRVTEPLSLADLRREVARWLLCFKLELVVLYDDGGEPSEEVSVPSSRLRLTLASPYRARKRPPRTPTLALPCATNRPANPYRHVATSSPPPSTKPPAELRQSFPSLLSAPHRTAATSKTTMMPRKTSTPNMSTSPTHLAARIQSQVSCSTSAAVFGGARWRRRAMRAGRSPGAEGFPGRGCRSRPRSPRTSATSRRALASRRRSRCRSRARSSDRRYTSSLPRRRSTGGSGTSSLTARLRNEHTY